MTFGIERLSIRAKLAIILGMTIFALAATRALGLSQLGGFLDRFAAYTAALESTQKALLAVNSAERGLGRSVSATNAAGAEAQAEVASSLKQADEALAELERLAPAAGLEVHRVRELRAAVRSSPVPRAALDHPQGAALRELVTRLSARFEAARAEAAAAYDTETRIMNATYMSMLLLVLGAGAIAYVLIAKMITRPLGSMVQMANTVASGDLRGRIDTSRGDELGQVMRALAGMNQGLAGLIGRVRHASTVIRGGSGEIDSANAGLAERMAGQASAIEQTAATMEQLVAAVGKNAENARRAAERAGNASGVAEKGMTEVRRMVVTMEAIDAGAQRITDITGVINSIAFQTNILALNAAVEAARAGESGRGFAVVAAEVRALALKSSAAAGEIKGLIADSLQRVVEGGKAVQSAGSTMSDVVAAAREVTAIVADIAAISAEQANGLQEISRAVATMDQKTRQNSELVDRAARCARTMHEQAAVLHEAVAVFRLTEEALAAEVTGAGAELLPAGGYTDALLPCRLN